MNTATREYLRVVVEDIHTSVMATVDKEGYPVTCAIDIMDFDDEGLYFLTARGKSFYDRLDATGRLAFTAMKGDATMNTVAISFRGRVKEIGPDKLPDLFEKNKYMYEIYPTAESRKALTVFHIYEGTGEWFSMGNGDIKHDEFTLGAAVEIAEGYVVGEGCIGCGTCVAVCPRGAITYAFPAVIDPAHCIRCGNCFEVCPEEAIIKL